jgi:hypothetical protein
MVVEWSTLTVLADGGEALRRPKGGKEINRYGDERGRFKGSGVRAPVELTSFQRQVDHGRYLLV